MQQALSHAELSRARQHAMPPPDGRGGVQSAAKRPAASDRESMTRFMQVHLPSTLLPSESCVHLKAAERPHAPTELYIEKRYPRTGLNIWR